jgi:DNA-binding MarR family transcriptional regulator
VKPIARHYLTPEERNRGLRRAHGPEGRRRYSETMTRLRAIDREAVRILREQGLVPRAIGPELGMADSTVAKHLRALERDGLIEPVPSYLKLPA